MNSKRLGVIDFLRGVAIILVLFRHMPLTSYTINMGWIGVDLFFVLSGFLVSGLIFKEYQKSGKFDAVRFLIRRGFKIYPVFYLSLTIFTIIQIVNHKFWLKGFLAELFFLQNYLTGFGWSLFGVTWSLAVEEHFYFGLAFIMSVWVLKGWTNEKISSFAFERSLLILIVLAIGMRFASNIFMPNLISRNFTMTHLRYDSLLVGVLISYLYHFKRELFESWFVRIKRFIPFVALALLSFTPFIEPFGSFFVMTVGFSLLSIGFGLVLSSFVMDAGMPARLNRLFTQPGAATVMAIGKYSYSIYIVHQLVVEYIMPITAIKLITQDVTVLRFIVYFILSCTIGMLVSIGIEEYFLRLRDRYFPPLSEPASLTSEMVTEKGPAK